MYNKFRNFFLISFALLTTLTAHATSDAPYVNKTIDIKYTAGNHYQIQYLAADKIHWTNMEDKTQNGEEKIIVNKQTDDIYSFNWIEKTGVQVSQNINFKTGDVFAFLSWNDDKAEGNRGGRTSVAFNGTFTVVDKK